MAAQSSGIDHKKVPQGFQGEQHMRVNKKVAATVSALMMTTGLLAMAGSTTASAADGCNNNGRTVQEAIGARGQGIELRVNGSGDGPCAWGRIVVGAVGMHVWVDRSSDGGRTWEPQLGRREIESGGSVWTEVWRSRNGQLMRACGDSGYNTTIHCTKWY
ncbi:glycosyl hydrolase [Streptomyces sp. NPDC050564]|uniref:glycosyl hydrolase n=1 Tax=Streptomyces sp. NPDC050564 TaxID=3365631 RepID=UPI0037A690A1